MLQYWFFKLEQSDCLQRASKLLLKLLSMVFCSSQWGFNLMDHYVLPKIKQLIQASLKIPVLFDFCPLEVFLVFNSNILSGLCMGPKPNSSLWFLCRWGWNRVSRSAKYAQCLIFWNKNYVSKVFAYNIPSPNKPVEKGW